MNTKLLMTVSAIVLGLAGILLTFLPHEILNYFSAASPPAALALQVGGALYVGFAMTNWTAKAQLLGGIYGRPLVIGNLVHFVSGALALIKSYFSGEPRAVLVPLLIYLVFAICFAAVFFRSPVNPPD